MAKYAKYEIPETALIYEQSIKKEQNKKPKITREYMEIAEEMQEDLCEKREKCKTADQRKKVDQNIRLLEFLLEHFDLL